MLSYLNGSLAGKQEKRMAYRNFATDEAFAGAASATRESPANAAADLFTREEWTVIDLAEHDGVWSLKTESRLARLATWLFGIEPPRPLANKRLESLRRLAVRIWRQGKLTRAAVEEFVAAGFSSRQADAVLAKINRRQRLAAWPRGLA
jgi:hypothetical protein